MSDLTSNLAHFEVKSDIVVLNRDSVLARYSDVHIFCLELGITRSTDVGQLLVVIRLCCLGHRDYVRFAPKLRQIGSKWVKSLTFSHQISHFGLSRQSEKVADLFHLGPI